MNFIDDMLGNKISKEAMESQGTDKQDHFERKVQAHDWIKSVTELDPVQVEAEYKAKLIEEARALGKTAALDDVIADGTTPEEVVNRDYKRDVSSLSDYALAELLAEARGHKAQNTNEMYYELKEKAKKEVASSREGAEKALLELIPDNAQLDWQKAFKEYKKEETPAEPKEKDLYKSDVPEKDHDFQHPSEDKFKLPKDPEKVLPGNGREADERKEVTQEAGVLKADIVEGIGKDATKKAAAQVDGTTEDLKKTAEFDNLYTFLEAHPDIMIEMLMERLGPQEKAEMEASLSEMDEPAEVPMEGLASHKASLFRKAHCGHCAGDKKAYDQMNPGNQPPTNDPRDEAIREAFKQAIEGGGEEVMIDMLMKYMPLEDMKSILDDFSDEGTFEPDVEHYEHAGIPMAVSFMKHLMVKKAAACPMCNGVGKDLKNSQREHLACEKCGITYAEAELKQPEIKAQASKEDVIKMVKTAEVKSPWAVTVDPTTGQEVLARVEDKVTNTKESEEEKKEEILK
ncbi:MAG: hypothetical protein ACREBR_04510 [bacterium]